MAHDHNHNTGAPEVPEDLIADRVRGWHAFTRFTVANCVGIALLLILMLVFLRLI